MQFNSILIVLPILTVLMFDLGLSLRFADGIQLDHHAFHPAADH